MAAVPPICPACLDAAHRAGLADQAEHGLGAANGAVYRAGTKALGSASGAFRAGASSAGAFSRDVR